MAYLPLAHILEFALENACFFWGSVLGYGSPKTLSTVLVRNCLGDMAEFKPTVLVGVPAVWESVRKGVVGKVAESSSLLQNLFWGALSAKQWLVQSALGNIGVAILDKVVFGKVKQATGGRLRLCLTGGGPIAKETQVFISMVIAPMIGGYGLTETTG